MEKELVAEGSLFFEKASSLEVVKQKLIVEHDFKSNDFLMLDYDETLVRTAQNYLYGYPFDVLEEEVENFLKDFEDRGVRVAIITNRPRENHPLTHRFPVFGYEYYTEKTYLQTLEYLFTLGGLGSLYKETPRCHCEIAGWVTSESGLGNIAVVGNSVFDQKFAKKLDKVLREKWDFENNLYMYKLPTLRSFRKN